MRNCSPPDERRPQGPQTHRQTLIMSSLSSVSGTKLSQHAPASSPTGTKLSQHAPASSPTGTKLSQHAPKGPFQPVLPEQGELCTASTTTTPSRENFVPRPVPNPVQNSPNTPPPAAHPVQNSPSTPTNAHFSPFCTSRENFVPHPPPRPPAGRTFYHTQHQTRYKTLPTHPHQQPNRYKTLPARPQTPISARFARAGRTLYRIHHHDPQQGELCTAPSTKPGTKLPQHTPASSPTGTKLSQHAHTSSPTGTKLSQHAHKRPFQPVLPEQGELCTAPSTKPGTKLPQHAPASNPPGTKLSQRPRSTAVPRKSSPSTPHTTTEPRKSSPSTPKNGVFRLFHACRAIFFAHRQATSHAGRIISRTGDRTGSADEGRMR